MLRGNLFETPAIAAQGELVQQLADGGAFRLERIVSAGHATPPGEWYDQAQDEWVVLLSGKAALLFEGESEVHRLQPGDYLLIPSRLRHRVEWTDATQPTVWLAIHFQDHR